MSLDNLIGKSLESIVPDAGAIRRLLDAAERNIADAHIEGLSNENKFDMAYKAIMQLANISLQASGYRTLTSKPGHHQTMIQSLPKTIGLEIDQCLKFNVRSMGRSKLALFVRSTKRDSLRRSSPKCEHDCVG